MSLSELLLLSITLNNYIENVMHNTKTNRHLKHVENITLFHEKIDAKTNEKTLD